METRFEGILSCYEETRKTTIYRYYWGLGAPGIIPGLGAPGIMPGLGAIPICGIPGAIIPGLGAIPICGIHIGGIPIGLPRGIPVGIPAGIFARLPVTGALAIT